MRWKETGIDWKSTETKNEIEIAQKFVEFVLMALYPDQNLHYMCMQTFFKC